MTNYHLKTYDHGLVLPDFFIIRYLLQNKLKIGTLPTFVYQFLRIGATSRCPGCVVGTILRYHYFVVVPEITTREACFSPISGSEFMSADYYQDHNYNKNVWL